MARRKRARRKKARRARVKRAKVRRARAKARRAKVSKKEIGDLKLALVILVFGVATAFSAVYKLGNITILLGLVTIAAALAMLAKKR